jgi:hypothetical protein
MSGEPLAMALYVVVDDLPAVHRGFTVYGLSLFAVF